MGRGVDQRVDDLELLDDRAGPAVVDQRQRIRVARAHVDEVDVQPVDLGDELRQHVQPGLALAPVVFAGPVLRQFAHGGQRHALRFVGHGFLLGPLGGGDAPAQVVEPGLRHVHPERAVAAPGAAGRGCGWPAEANANGLADRTAAEAAMKPRRVSDVGKVLVGGFSGFMGMSSSRCRVARWRACDAGSARDARRHETIRSECDQSDLARVPHAGRRRAFEQLVDAPQQRIEREPPIACVRARQGDRQAAGVVTIQIPDGEQVIVDLQAQAADLALRYPCLPGIVVRARVSRRED